MIGLEDLSEAGVLKLPGWVPAAATRSARQAALNRLRARQIWPGKGSARYRRRPIFQQTTALSAELVDVCDLSVLFEPALAELAASVLQGPVVAAATQWLVSLPGSDSWGLSGLNWHRDAKGDPGRLPGLQAFVLIDDLSPRGGGTLALAGSHRQRPSRGRQAGALSACLRSGLDASMFDAPFEVEGLSLRLVEMCGRAGDVYLMDMRVLHTPSANAAARPRLMATTRFLRPSSSS